MRFRFHPFPAAPAALACLALALAGCHRDAGPVVVGVVGPWARDYAASTRRGIELAAAEVNRGGGIGGRPLVVSFRDDSADASRAVRIVGEFADDPRVMAVVGPLNSGPLVAAARVVDGRLVAVAPTAASPELNGISPWVFRLISNDSVFGITLGRNALRLGRRAAVLYDNNAFGRGGADAFRRNFGGSIVSADPIWPGDADVSTFLTFYRRQEVDLVYVAGLTPSGLAVLREARRQGFRGAVLGTDSWTSLLADAGVADGVYIATRFSVLEPRPEVARFNAAYLGRWHAEPDGFAAFGYDAVQIVARALREAGTDRAAVREWLAGLRRTAGYPGVTGRIRFSPGGEPEGSRFVLLQVKGGKLRLAEGR
jgi:branched-chain amino acid transport system substrate-binding protein